MRGVDGRKRGRDGGREEGWTGGWTGGREGGGPSSHAITNTLSAAPPPTLSAYRLARLYAERVAIRRSSAYPGQAVCVCVRACVYVCVCISVTVGPVLARTHRHPAGTV